MNGKRSGLLALFFAVPLLAAVDGVVVNRTTGRPQADATVTLIQPGQAGMQTLGTTRSGPDGAFRIDAQAGPGPQLVQAAFEGVTYNKMLVPGTPTSGVQVEVYNSTPKPGAAHVEQHMVLLQPRQDGIAVSETFMYQNASQLTWNDPRNGTLHFWVQPGARGDVRVTITAPGGMPVKRTAEETGQKNTYKISYPVKPGETRIDVSYNLPASDPMTAEGRILHDQGATRLVTPPGVTLTGDDVTLLGQEPQTQASIYDVKGKTWKVGIQGLVADAESSGEDDGSPQIRQAQPHVYDRLPVLVGISLGILALGTVLLYRRGGAQPQ